MSFVSSKSPHRHLGKAGITSLEFALISFLFMFIIMGVFDIARYLYTVQALETLAARISRMHPRPEPGSNEAVRECATLKKEEIATIAPSLLNPNLVTVRWPVASCRSWGNSATSVAFTVHYDYSAMFLVMLDGTLTRTATINYGRPASPG